MITPYTKKHLTRVYGAKRLGQLIETIFTFSVKIRPLIKLSYINAKTLIDNNKVF